MEETVLLVEDDDALRGSLAELLKDRGYRVVTSRTAQEGIRLLSDSVSAVVTDLKLPDASGMEVLRAARREDPELPVVVMTGYGSTPSIVEAMREGAFHYIDKPVDPDALFSILGDALKHRARAREIMTLRQALDEKYGFENLIGNSEPMHRTFEKIRQVAPVRTSVLIEGASGTGKELVARAIHHLSPRRSGPFVALNCAAIPANLVESELFGHEKGSFTGADSRRIGKFQQADAGTLFIDEIGEMELGIQAKFLRVLETQEITPVGGNEVRKVDARVIAASNRELKKLVAEGRFREDLYFRVNVVRIFLPPLRERIGDIPLLVRFFLDRLAKEHGRPPLKVDPEALKRLENYSWPGNVRELKNLLESITVLSARNQITVADLPVEVAGAHDQSPSPRFKLGMSLPELEREAILKTLEGVGGNRTRAAEILQISLRTLQRKLKEYGLSG